MLHPIPAAESFDRKLPPPNPLVMLLVVVLWLTFACALPFHQVNEERRRARQDLLRILAADKPDQSNVIAAFDRSNKDLDAAASGPCLLLAFTIIFLVNQLLKLKRRYNALEYESSTPSGRDARFHNASEN